MLGKLSKIVLLVLFILFLSLYSVGKSSYYDYGLSKKVSLTNNQIKEFETKIEKGENIDLNSYYSTNNENDNSISNISLKVSNTIGKVFCKLIEGFFSQAEKAIGNN